MTLTHLDIEVLLQRCLNKEQAAQLEVYDRYYKAMYNTSLRIVKDSAEAEDVMQESFLIAFTKLETFKGEASFGSWLKRIVVNTSISAYRKKLRLAEVPLDNSLYKLEDEPAATPCDTSVLEVQQVMNSMNALKENYRIVLSLHLIEGYDYKEVSAILKISYANCRTMISRAKESLRNKLATS
ncbi:RNA polymerase sigma factor [Flavimarina sp. Hel_I_48]|uniref:RNA polymerase sigma factor n=1 Tax=Flavimarina sp. Hel_I_48 TaxID=1392488 RepID=UPI0004DF8153|nr:RNA polymerase sigma factor [Flavimarina sp. Hel_I_48]